MNKKALLWFLLELMVAVIFYTLFFSIAGPDAPRSAWVACIFFTVSLVFTVATPFIFRRSKTKNFLGIPVGYISLGYYALEFIIAFIFVLMRQESSAPSVTIQLIVCVLYCIVVLSVLLVNEYKNPAPQPKEVPLAETEPEKNSHKEVLVLSEPADSPEASKPAEKTCESSFVDDATEALKSLLNKCEDKKTSRELERVYDSVRSSMKYSTSSAKMQETAMINKITVLTKEVDAHDYESACATLGEIMTLLEKRNRLVRG